MGRLLLVLVFATSVAIAQDKPEETLSAVVGVSAKIQANARSAESLGTQRRGTGVLIREGYVLTIGYLVIEAEAIEVTGADGRTVPATLAGYDHASGFGLLQAGRRRSPARRCRWAIRRALARARAGDGGDRAGARRRRAWCTWCRAGRSRATGNTCSTRRSSLTRRCMDWSGAPLIGAERRAARHRLAHRPGRGRAGDAVARQHVRAGRSAQADPGRTSSPRAGATARRGPGSA